MMIDFASRFPPRRQSTRKPQFRDSRPGHSPATASVYLKVGHGHSSSHKAAVKSKSTALSDGGNMEGHSSSQKAPFESKNLLFYLMVGRRLLDGKGE